MRGKKHVLEFNNDKFPEALRQIPYPPKRLYCLGNPDALTEGLAIVGARRATPYGLSCAKHFGEIAARAGVTIISGGAYGCDSESHRAALSVGGKTVVFLGGGCDKPYPVRNVNLYQDIIDSGGAIVSENYWDCESYKSSFLQRNRLIAGLAKATLVVEAGVPSGTFTTADFAIDAGKELLAVPGPITYSGSRGCNRLIYQGAIPVVDDDVFYDFLYTTYNVIRPSDIKTEQKVKHGEKVGQSNNPILEALSAQPINMDQLYEFAKTQCGRENPNVWLSKKLVEAESSGKITKYKNGMYGPVVR
ncbi:MAG: DNA-processing protein DprA [Coriobacteriia bacterium]|nr:DNA-processing protein DprA [Coriobacteriia bacterium]